MAEHSKGVRAAAEEVSGTWDVPTTADIIESHTHAGEMEERVRLFVSAWQEHDDIAPRVADLVGLLAKLDKEGR